MNFKKAIIALIIFSVFLYSVKIVIDNKDKISILTILTHKKSKEVKEQNYDELSNRQKAIKIINEKQEIIDWRKLFQTEELNNENVHPKGTPIIEVNAEKENLITIHVYELLNGRTATFNWYIVNIQTKEVTILENKNTN